MPVDHEAVLEAPLPAALVPELLARLAYVSEHLEHAEVPAEGRDRVLFRLSRAASVDPAEVAGRIAGLARRLCASYRPVERVIRASRPGTGVGPVEDPHDELRRRGEMVEVGRGRVALGSLLAGLVERLDGTLRRWSDRFGARPARYPALIGAEVLDRCGYIRSFPHALAFVSHLREEMPSIEQVGRVAWDGDALPVDRDHLAPVRSLLSPSVCFHCYAVHAGQRLDRPAVITAEGRCFRWEGRNLRGLERLWDFGMREVVSIGARDDVLGFREATIEAAIELLDGWGLAYTIESATDPFFVPGEMAVYQAAFQLKFEVRAALPYRPGASLAVGSFNYHQDFFGKAFGIQDPSGQPASTSCVGFGLERLALALVAQHGIDPAGWPPSLQPARAG